MQPVRFTSGGIWSKEEIDELGLKSDGEALLRIFHKLDFYQTGTVTRRSFKEGIIQLAAQQLVLYNGPAKLATIERQLLNEVMVSFFAPRDLTPILRPLRRSETRSALSNMFDQDYTIACQR